VQVAIPLFPLTFAVRIDVLHTYLLVFIFLTVAARDETKSVTRKTKTKTKSGCIVCGMQIGAEFTAGKLVSKRDLTVCSMILDERYMFETVD